MLAVQIVVCFVMMATRWRGVSGCPGAFRRLGDVPGDDRRP